MIREDRHIDGDWKRGLVIREVQWIGGDGKRVLTAQGGQHVHTFTAYVRVLPPVHSPVGYLDYCLRWPEGRERRKTSR